MKGVLVIIPCGGRKIWKKNPNKGPTPAREAYIGAPFKVNKEYAEKFGEKWIILSAKYGFITPEFIIPGPYEVTFKKKSTNPVSVKTLQEQIQSQGLNKFEMMIVLGGKEYRTIVEEAFAPFGVKVSFPFAGLDMFKVMSATKTATRTNEPFLKLE